MNADAKPQGKNLVFEQEKINACLQILGELPQKISIPYKIHEVTLYLLNGGAPEKEDSAGIENTKDKAE